MRNMAAAVAGAMSGFAVIVAGGSVASVAFPFPDSDAVFEMMERYGRFTDFVTLPTAAVVVGLVVGNLSRTSVELTGLGASVPVLFWALIGPVGIRGYALALCYATLVVAVASAISRRRRRHP